MDCYKMAKPQVKADLTLNKALALALGDLPQPVVTYYQIGVLLCQLCLSKNYKGIPVSVRRSKFPDRPYLNSAIRRLEEHAGILSPNKNFSGHNVFNIFGKTQSSPEEIICSADPFAYISHLSAMEFHGLTDRLPTSIFYSTPAPVDWKKFAEEKMKKDCDGFLIEYIENSLPKLTRIAPGKINKQPVKRYSSVHQGAFKSFKDKNLRVATIGRTFLDMLREPKFCGGINHVIDVYKNHANQYSNLITNELDRHGTLIEKTRAGYILEELCGIHEPKIDSWAQQVQRGGSRKLDPSSDYSSNYSERWCLSINL